MFLMDICLTSNYVLSRLWEKKNRDMKKNSIKPLGDRHGRMGLQASSGPGRWQLKVPADPCCWLLKADTGPWRLIGWLPLVATGPWQMAHDI